MGLFIKRPSYMVSLRARTRHIFYSVLFSFVLFCSVLMDMFMICRSSGSRLPFCCHATMLPKAKNLFARLRIGTVPSTKQYPHEW
jgi:hypothetical protein